MFKPRQANRLTFSVMEGAFWVMVFLTEGLFSSYLSDFGYGESFIGVSLMSTGIAAMVLGPVYGYLVDKTRRCRLMLLVLTGVVMATTPLFFLFSHSGVVILLYSVTAMSAIKGAMSVLDSWISKLIRETPGIFDYGRLRSIGSISYAIAAAVFGRVLAVLGNRFASVLMVVVWVVIAVCALRSPDPSVGTQGETVRLRFAIRELVRERSYLLFLLCGFLVSVTSQSAFTFYPLLIRGLGGDVGDVGLAYFILAASEFLVVMHFSKIAAKLGTAWALGLGMIGYALKNLVLSMSPNLPFALAASVLQAVSFAFVVPGSVQFINETISRTYVASALVLYQGVQNLAQITSSPIIGAVSERTSVTTMFAGFAAPAVVGGILFLLVVCPKWRRRKETELADPVD